MTGNLVWGNWSSEECNQSYQQVSLQILLVSDKCYTDHQGHFILKLGYCFHILMATGVLWMNCKSSSLGFLQLHNETGNKSSCRMRQLLFPICVGHIFRLTVLTLGETSRFSDSHCQVLSLPVFPVPVKWLCPSKAHSMGLGLSIFAQATY